MAVSTVITTLRIFPHKLVLFSLFSILFHFKFCFFRYSCGLFHFSFWQQKEKQKQKERLPAALFWLFPRLFPLNKKNSLRSNSFLFLTLQQPPPFHAKKDEAGTLAQHCFARCSLMFSCSLVACTCHPEERSDEGSVHIRHNKRSNVLQTSTRTQKRAKQRSANIRRAP